MESGAFERTKAPQPNGLLDPKQSHGLIPGYVLATRVLLLSFVCVLAYPQPLEVFLRVEHLDLQLEPVCDHNFREFGIDQLPVLEVVTLLGWLHRAKGFFVSVVGQRNFVDAFGTEAASHAMCMLDVFPERCSFLLVR